MQVLNNQSAIVLVDIGTTAQELLHLADCISLPGLPKYRLAGATAAEKLPH